VKGHDGFVKGMRLEIGQGNLTETAVLKDIGSLVLESGVANTHAEGTVVKGYMIENAVPEMLARHHESTKMVIREEIKKFGNPEHSKKLEAINSNLNASQEETKAIKDKLVQLMHQPNMVAKIVEKLQPVSVKPATVEAVHSTSDSLDKVKIVICYIFLYRTH